MKGPGTQLGPFIINLIDMDTPTYTMYFYTRYGEQYCTPSIDVAFKRNMVGDVTQVTYEPER